MVIFVQFLLVLTVSVFSLAYADDGRNLVVQANQSAGRIALVIGNGAYQDSPLKNPPNDAEDMSATLKKLDFEVILLRNANQHEMKSAIREFGQKLRGSKTGLFYYAGHGLQVKGVNYLVPVAVDIASEADAEDQTVSLDYVLRTMEESGAKFNIAILDACRNNPFVRSFRSASRGLASTQSANGMLIAYATAPGSVASDGDDRNGMYTKHLLKNLREGDSDILKIFQRVRTGVVTETNSKQTPWETTSLVGEFFMGGVPQASTSNPPKVSGSEQGQEKVRHSEQERGGSVVMDPLITTSGADYIKESDSNLTCGEISSELIELQNSQQEHLTTVNSIQNTNDVAGGTAEVARAAKIPFGGLLGKLVSRSTREKNTDAMRKLNYTSKRSDHLKTLSVLKKCSSSPSNTTLTNTPPAN